MIKIYGKGDTVSNSEYWDGRTTYNGLTQYLKNLNNNVALRDIFNDNNEIFAFMESINSSQYVQAGVVRNSFSNEFDIKSTDFFETTINNITRYYVRCSPGIGVNNGYAYINKPATELAVAELAEILLLDPDDDESIEIRYNYEDDTFKARINIIVDKRMEVLIFANDNDFENDNQPGYNTGIEMIYEMYNDINLTKYFDDSIGDDLAKVDLEKTVLVTIPDTYYWTLSASGVLNLEVAASGNFEIGNLTIADLGVGISAFDNTHVYSGETEVVSGNLIITGTTESVDKDSGALIVEGGVGVEKNLNVGGDFTVTGDLTVEGTTVIIDVEEVQIEDNILVLNANQTGTPLPSLKSGIEVERGDFTNYQFIFDEDKDSFYVGEIGYLQPVATREEIPTDTGVAVWNATNTRFEATRNPDVNSVTFENNKHNIIVNDGGGNFNIRVGNNFADGCTEAGFASHWVFNQSNGEWVLKTSTTSLAVNDTPTWQSNVILSQNGDTTILKDLYANRIYGAVWNDIAEFMKKAGEAKPGDVMIMTDKGIMPSYKGIADKRVVGVYSDTFGYALGSKDKQNKYPIGISGRVWVKVKEPLEVGDLLVSSFDGFAKKRNFWTPQGRILGKVTKYKYGYNVERVEMLIMMG